LVGQLDDFLHLTWGEESINGIPAKVSQRLFVKIGFFQMAFIQEYILHGA
jgi:hypothetical protein